MKKAFFLSLWIFSLLLGVTILISPQGVSFADDDEEREEEGEDEEDERSEKKNNTESESVKTSTPPSVPVTTITQKTTTTVLKDSDGDGLYNNEDPHPTIPEIYIVQDENRNGIVDHFEIPPS
jgi:hypothetical protein